MDFKINLITVLINDMLSHNITLLGTLVNF